MNIIKRYIKSLRGKAHVLPVWCGLVGLIFTSCVDNDFDDSKGTFYSSTKLTAAEYINQNLDRFSSFKSILEKSNYFTTLATYGTYTVYLPTNDAIDIYLKSQGLSSIEQLPKAMCDTLSRAHIISKGAYFTSDYSVGKLPEMNMDDHFIVLSNDSDENNKLQIFVNQNAQIIEKDDSMTNGVVHVINRALSSSNEFVADYLRKDTAVSIFAEALQITHMNDSLAKYLDMTYSCGEDSVRGEIPSLYYGGHDHIGENLRYPDKRYFKYTIFCETNEVFRKNNVHNIEDLKKKAKELYDKTYPEDAGKYDSLFTDRRNPLNRFISYHIIDRIGAYTDWAPSGDIYANNWKPEVADAEDFWETMCPGQLIRFCRLSGGKLYANRKGKGNAAKPGCEGVRVLDDSESRNVNKDPKIDRVGGPLNGTYLYLNDILWYSPTVREELLNSRMRIDATTLSPDFMNQDGRGHYGKHILTAFKNDYIKNFKVSDETIIAVHNDDMWWSSYLGNAVCVKGRFDMQFKLPPVPTGLYEIRLGYVARDNGSTMQVYLNDQPCGIPFNQTIGAWDARVGFVEDKTEADIPNEQERLEYNKSIDKAMRNRLYMKAMDSYRKGTAATSFRVDAPESLRRILTTAELENGKEYWLRFRKADNSSPDTEFSFDYIEIVPSNVYNNPNGEDQH